MLRVGLTGGIGSGKSTVSAKFHTLFKTPVIDADEINQRLLIKNSSAYTEIVTAFGASILTSTGDIDRKILRQKIFSSKQSRTQLEAILHPRIKAEIARQINTLECAYVLVVVPLLVELNLQDQFDRICVIDVGYDMQLARVSKRDNCSQADVAKIVASQIEAESRIRYADDIINNNADMAALNEQIHRLHKKYVALSK